MFDINAIVSAALTAAVEAATKPLLERIVALENAYYIDYRALADRLTALENNPAIGVDTTLLARVVEMESNAFAMRDSIQALENEKGNTLSNSLDNLNGHEWFWEKVSRKAGQAAQAVVEEAMDDHCSGYDHDNYDRVSSAVDELELDDLVKREDLRVEVEDIVNNATVSIRL